MGDEENKAAVVRVLIEDRIKVEKGFTYGVSKYNFAKWSFTWETGVRPGETPQQAKERAEALVEKWNAEEQEKWDKA